MSKRVLLIDADQPLVSTLTGELEARGFEVLHTADGKDALDLARAQAPDLVVLCVELPKGSGYSICSKLKKDEALRAIPVVLTSAEATQKAFDDHKKLKIGRADEYLRKPFDGALLLERIGALIGLPESAEAPVLDGEFDISSLAEEVSVEGEEPVAIEEVEEIALESADVAPTPEHLPGDEDLAMLDAAFETVSEDDKPLPSDDEPLGALADELHTDEGDVASTHAPQPTDEHDDLLAGLDAPAGVETLEPLGASGGADAEELERLRERVASLESQLESQAAADAGKVAASGSRDKDYFAVKEKLSQREREFLKIREELTGREKELVEQRDREMSLERDLSAKDGEIAKRDVQLKTLQQKIDALVAGQRRSEKDLAAAREEAKQATAQRQAAEARRDELESTSGAREAEISRLTDELETATRRVTELESDLSSERSRTDELSAELHGTRTQLEETQGSLEELRRRAAELEEQNAKGEERALKAYQKIKGDEKLRDKVKKAVGIALQLLDEPSLEVDDLTSEEQRS